MSSILIPPPKPASLCEFMLAGHSASSCDLSFSIQDLGFDVPGLDLSHSRDLKGIGNVGAAHTPCHDSSTLPVPIKFCKKSTKYSCFSDPDPQTSLLEAKRAIRRAMGSAIAQDEPAHWSCSAEVRQVSVTNVSKLLSSYLDDEIEN